MTPGAFDFAQDFDEGFDPEVTDSPNDVWTDSDWNDSPIAELETRYLSNIIRGLEAGKYYWGQDHKLPNLKAELARRER